MTEVQQKLLERLRAPLPHKPWGHDGNEPRYGVSEERLADEFGFSRMLVNAALLKLAEAGLVRCVRISRRVNAWKAVRR